MHRTSVLRSNHRPRRNLFRASLSRVELILLAALLLCPAAVHAANYERICEPAIKPVFLPLPPGSVEPSGWLRDWAMAARDGITGHLDEYHPTFADAWKGIRIREGNAISPDGTTGGPLEQCAYWFDGALRLGLVLHDEALIRKIRCPARSHCRRRRQGRFRHVLHLLEKGVQAAKDLIVGRIRKWAARWWRSIRAPATSGCSTPW